MSKYTISETYACWVKWTRVVEATNMAEALELFNDGAGEPADYSPEIGDILDGYEGDGPMVEAQST